MNTMSSNKSNIETELRLYDADAVTIRRALNATGSRSLGSLAFKRAVFDTIPYRKERWIRLRTDGNKTTLAVKERTGDASDSEEYEITVDDFDNTLTILEKIGVSPRSVQENSREQYEIDVESGTVEVSIDRWPILEYVVEFEGATLTAIYDVAASLGISRERLTGESVEDRYSQIGIDVKNIPELTFSTEL
jgi:adenylate cyclase class 2